LSQGDPPNLFSAAELSHLTPSGSTVSSYAFFRLISPSGDQGFLGKLVTEALIALIGPIKAQDSVNAAADDSVGSIVIVYRAKLDEGATKVVTPINLTQVRLHASISCLPNSDICSTGASTSMQAYKMDSIAFRFKTTCSLSRFVHDPLVLASKGDRFLQG